MAFAERSESGRERIDVAVADLAAQQRGLVTAGQIIDLGGTSAWISRRVGAGLLIRVLPRVVGVRGFPSGWEQKAMAVSLWAGAGGALSHASAACIWGLRPAGFPITITIPSNLRAPQPWVVVKRVTELPSRDVSTRNGLIVTTPSRTLLDLGSVIEIDVLEEVLDAALHRGLTSVARMKWQVEMSAKKGVPGVRAVRSLLEERDPEYRPTHSVLETTFRRLLKRHGFPQPEQQHVVHRGPAKKAQVDFLYPDIKLAIEVDGYSWHGHRAAWQNDLDRQNDLVIAGLRVLRFTWHDVQRREGLVASKLRPFFGTQLSLSESCVDEKGEGGR